MLTVDSIAPLASLIRAKKLKSDPRYLGELARFSEDPSVRKSYFRRDGLTIDELCEAAWDAGITSHRITEREMLDLLERVFVDGRGKARNTDTSRHVAAAEVHAVDVRRKTRLRLFQCAECGRKRRAATDSEEDYHLHVDPDSGAERFVPYKLQTIILRPVAPF